MGRKRFSKNIVGKITGLAGLLLASTFIPVKNPSTPTQPLPTQAQAYSGNSTDKAHYILSHLYPEWTLGGYLYNELFTKPFGEAIMYSR